MRRTQLLAIATTALLAGLTASVALAAEDPYGSPGTQSSGYESPTPSETPTPGGPTTQSTPPPTSTTPAPTPTQTSEQAPPTLADTGLPVIALTGFGIAAVAAGAAAVRTFRTRDDS